MIDSSTIIAIASDHGGFEMKEFIKTKLETAGYRTKDFGTHSDSSVDYPDMIHPLQMTANKYSGIRAGLCWNEEQAMLTRLHNNANILALPGRFIPLEQAWKITRIFLTTDFEGGRHTKRVDKIAINS